MRQFSSLCVLAALGLAGCTGAHQVSSTPPSTSYNPPTVTYELSGGDLTTANSKAALYCQNYNATPHLLAAGNDRATYQCVGGTAGVNGAPVGSNTVVVNPPPPSVITGPPVATAPLPTVSYPVVGGDVSGANMSAANYCRQYGRTAQLNTVTGGTAYYSCL